MPLLNDISEAVNVIDPRKHVMKLTNIFFVFFWFYIFVFCFWKILYENENLFVFLRFYIYTYYTEDMNRYHHYSAASSASSFRVSGVKHLIPNLSIRNSILSWPRALVKMSANWYSVLTKYSSTTPFSTCSLMKWYRMSICFEREC